MNDDTPVIGAFIVRQFLYIFAGFGLASIVWRYVDNMIIAFPLTAGIMYVALRQVKSAAPPELTPEYIERRRAAAKNADEFKAWVTKRIAIINDQINEQAVKGRVPDPKLDEQKALLEQARADAR